MQKNITNVDFYSLYAPPNPEQYFVLASFVCFDKRLSFTFDFQGWERRKILETSNWEIRKVQVSTGIKTCQTSKLLRPSKRWNPTPSLHLVSLVVHRSSLLDLLCSQFVLCCVLKIVIIQFRCILIMLIFSLVFNIEIAHVFTFGASSNCSVLSFVAC